MNTVPLVQRSPAVHVLTILAGKIRVFSFRGEQDNATVRVVEASEGQAVYIHQGAYHLVENAADGQTKFLQVGADDRAMQSAS
jgi:oxalate decarboxylase/phosphoglucose isomerase-like protein (cupin superfamily)